MAKTYKGSLSLEWYNKQKSILIRDAEGISRYDDIPAPRINWVNKDEALFYEINEEEGKGMSPYWVNRNDIRVKEARPLIFQKAFKAILKNKPGTLSGTDTVYEVKELKQDDPSIENILIKGDNLLALNTLKKMFDNKPNEEKIKCIYFDLPFNTGQSFERYDDNLEHSEWLTMIRDRIEISYHLLRNDGCLLIHLDDREVPYARVMLDEIFGRANYVNTITVEANSPSGFRATSDGLFKSSNYILFYTKDKSVFSIKKIFIEKEYDTAYKFIFDDILLPEDKWTWQNINNVVAKELNFSNVREAKTKIGDQFEVEVALYAIKNAARVFRTAAVSGGAYLKRKTTVEKSKKIKDRIIRHPNDDMDYQFIGGEMVVYYKDRLIEIDGQLLPGKIVTDLWTDIAWEGIAKEGGVDFPKSKKPEKLIYRIFDMTTEEGDFIFDGFGGSGTTIAVAHKMKRKWIGIEIGNHANDLIVPRLKNILRGNDQSGISKLPEVNWCGGGSFKYYNLGTSIIKINKDGTSDFNWSLGQKFIEESFLSSYDYSIVSDISFSDGKLFSHKDIQPSIGIQHFGSKSRVAIVTLNQPVDKNDILSYDELMLIYRKVKKEFSPEYVNIFTNRGVEIAFDSKPDDMEVIKVPHAIFVELEK